MPISESDLRYLDNKHRGGVNNANGNAYEHYYAIYRISTLLFLHKDNLHDIKIGSQIRAFIDDLYVKEFYHMTYYQIKNVHELSWNYGKNGHTLINDCILQHELSSCDSEESNIVIVYSDENSALQPIPEEISSFAKIELFPFCDSLNQLLYIFEPFRNSIKSICSLENPKNDDLDNIAKTLLGHWVGENSSEVCLDDFYNSVHKNKSLPIIGFNTECISEECKSLFDSFSIEYRIIENKLIWNYKDKLKGKIVWTVQKDNDLVNSNIMDFWHFIELLY